MFVSSKAASISSKIAKGAGFVSNIANKSATAVRAFSPPDKSVIDFNDFDGGRAIISTPANNTFSSSSLSLASPPVSYTHLTLPTIYSV